MRPPYQRWHPAKQVLARQRLQLAYREILLQRQNRSLSVYLTHGSRDRVSISWDQPFFNPIILPDGRKLVTLRDAAQFITKASQG
jgi:hypothetical protein